jgi:hypothetical protein
MLRLKFSVLCHFDSMLPSNFQRLTYNRNKERSQVGECKPFLFVVDAFGTELDTARFAGDKDQYIESAMRTQRDGGYQ